jgi:hypothetical protein
MDVEHWDAGTLRIGEEYMDEWAQDRDADVGIEVKLHRRRGGVQHHPEDPKIRVHQPYHENRPRKRERVQLRHHLPWEWLAGNAYSGSCLGERLAMDPLDSTSLVS